MNLKRHSAATARPVLSGNDGARARGVAWTGSWVTRLALAVVLVNVSYLAWRLSPSPRPAVPAYGDPMPPWNGTAAGDVGAVGREFFRGHFGVLLYAHLPPDARLVRYLQVLLDRYRDYGVGLRIVLVLAPEHMGQAVAEELAREVDFLVIRDSKGDLGRALGLQPHTAHGFLVDPGERLAFSSRGLPSRDELRQHVEKHLLGEIQYAASPVSLLGPGALLPEYEVVEVGEGSGREVFSYAPASGTVVVVFAAALCSACGPDETYDQLALLYRNKCRSSAECPVELLVTAGFPTAKLLSSLQARGVERLPIYRAKGTLAGLEDEYFTKRRSDAAEALVLTMGGGGKVLAVSSLERAAEVSHVR